MDFDRRLRRGVLRAGAHVLFVVHDDTEALEREMRLEGADVAAQQHGKRAVGRLVRKAHRLALFDVIQDGLHELGMLVQIEA